MDAGLSLDVLLRHCVPLGWWPPVLPGTRQVTIGGAIACDIHGKNHHRMGSFASHIESLDLLTADGDIATLTPEDEPALFWATVGGIGLTGIILRARIRLQPTETSFFVVDTDRTAGLDETIGLLSDSTDDDYEYSMAWFDSISTGRRLGRAALSRGSLARLDDLPTRQRSNPLPLPRPALLSLPDVFPSGMANRVTVATIGELWYRRTPRNGRGQIQSLTAFYHPLDLVENWNRAYGPHGFLQYQFLVPFGAESTLTDAIRMIAESGHRSGVNVLKRFGPGNEAPLSFPMPGWNACVDLPIREGLDRLCHGLDELVVDAGGRLYTAKDSRTTPETFARMYPRLDEWRSVRDSIDPNRVFQSDMSRRLDL